MIKSYLSIIFLGLQALCFSQIDNKTYNDLDIKPSAQSGNKDPMTIVRNNLQYPMIAAEYGISGTVLIGFVINSNREVTDVEIINSVHESIDKEALTVFNLTLKSWIPGKKDGQAVDSYYEFPINFILQGKGIKKANYFYKNADKYYGKSDYSKAIEYLEQVRMRKPYDFNYLNKLAISYSMTGDLDKACAYWRRLEFLNQSVDQKYLESCN